MIGGLDVVAILALADYAPADPLFQTLPKDGRGKVPHQYAA